MKKGISILGSTGSIGKQSLEVVEAFHSSFKVTGLAAKNNIPLLEEQIRKFSPRMACVEGEDDAKKLAAKLGKTTTAIYSGLDGLKKLAVSAETEVLVSAIPGSRGLIPTLEAVRSGKTIALASKEILVAAGDIVMAQARRYRSKVIPLDSEHSAIMQCLKGEDPKKIRSIVLTASGGPFLTTPLKEQKNITPDMALSHPTWNMGRKVTIDSATLMNKGFEVIEAHHLFNVDYSKIKVLIHPQSIVHAMVEFEDGSFIAQLSYPDMRLPIQYALLGASREESKFNKLELEKMKSLSFEEADEERSPCLKLCFEAGKRGGTSGAVISAADEVAVELFLSGKLKFNEIFEMIKEVLKRHEVVEKPSLEDILDADRWAKDEARSLV